jgi:hypothetical protein
MIPRGVWRAKANQVLSRGAGRGAAGVSTTLSGKPFPPFLTDDAHISEHPQAGAGPGESRSRGPLDARSSLGPGAGGSTDFNKIKKL